MKITVDKIVTVALQDFADLHGFEIIVKERPTSIMRDMGMEETDRYYAQFENVEVSGDGVLIGIFGNGMTPHDAIVNYCQEIEGKKLIFKAYSTQRKEIWAPVALTYAKDFNNPKKGESHVP